MTREACGWRPEVGPGRSAQLRRARFLAGGPTARAPEKKIPITCRYLSVLEAYLDESDRSDVNPRLFSMAGWLGDGRAWRSFEPRWEAILRDDRFGVSEFKSSDFANRKGEFEDWSDDRCAPFLSELLDVIQAIDVIGVEVVLSLNEPEDKWARALRDADYLACACHCMVLLIHIAAIRHVEGERVAFLFDERQKGRGKIQEIKKNIKARLRAALAKRVGPMESDGSLEILPLQAADLLAYWAYPRRQHELRRSSERDDALLEVMSPTLTPKVAIRRILSWEPGFLHESAENSDTRWNIEGRLPELSLEYFEKPQMSETSKRAIWDANWARLKRMFGGKPDD